MKTKNDDARRWSAAWKAAAKKWKSRTKRTRRWYLEASEKLVPVMEEKQELIAERDELQRRLEEARCSVCNQAIVIDGLSVHPCPCLAEARHELANIIEFLDSLGPIAGGDSVRERAESVIRHYAAQIGRYGQHESRCSSHWHPRTNPTGKTSCDCGLAAALIGGVG